MTAGRPSEYDAERIANEIVHYTNLCEQKSYLPTILVNNLQPNHHEAHAHQARLSKKFVQAFATDNKHGDAAYIKSLSEEKDTVTRNAFGKGTGITTTTKAR